MNRMDDFRITLPPETGMTLDAQLVGCWEIEKLLVLGSMGPVTARTLDGDVFVPRIDKLFPDWMGGVGLPLMAISAQFNNRFLFLQELVIGAVR